MLGPPENAMKHFVSLWWRPWILSISIWHNKMSLLFWRVFCTDFNVYLMRESIFVGPFSRLYRTNTIKMNGILQSKVFEFRFVLVLGNVMILAQTQICQFNILFIFNEQTLWIVHILCDFHTIYTRIMVPYSVDVDDVIRYCMNFEFKICMRFDAFCLIRLAP